MTNEQVINELKEKRLPTFGTRTERIERLKKFYGIVNQNVASTAEQFMRENSGPDKKKVKCLDEIEKLK